MPSELRDRKGVSLSLFSAEVPFQDGRHVGFWKADAVHNFHGRKTVGALSTVVSSPLEKRTLSDAQMTNGIERSNSYFNQDQKVNSSLSASLSLPRAFEDNLSSASYFKGGDRLNVMGSQYENGLFSSSLSDIFSRKLRLSSNYTPYGHSVDAANPHEEEEPGESFEQLEKQILRNLLPDGDDLFSGVTDGIDYKTRPGSGDETEDLDLFSSVGGLDLGEDGFTSGEKNPLQFNGNSNTLLGEPKSTIGGEHPFGEHPSRTLFVRNINSNIEDSELKKIFEPYGDIQTLFTACKYRGFVMIKYYDIRAAWNAMKALQKKPLRGRELDIHFSVPKDNPSEKDDINQGTIVVFNLDSSVSNEELHRIFGVYGDVKEIREASRRSHHKVIEFYDVRAADAAAHGLNGGDIAGKQIKLEPSHPGGSRRSMNSFPSELDQDESDVYWQRSSPPNFTSGYSGSLSHGGITSKVDTGTLLGVRSTAGLPIGPFVDNGFHHAIVGTAISSSVPNTLPSLLRVETFGNHSNTGEAGHSHGQLNYEIRGTSNFQPHSLPDYDDGLTIGVLGKSPGSMAVSTSTRVSSNGHSVELNDNVLNAPGSGSAPSPGHHYVWNNSHRPQPQGIMWSSSPSFVGGACSAHPKPLHPVARAPSQLANGLPPMNHHHVGSAPSVNPSLWETRHAYAGESPDASSLHPGSLGSMRIPVNSSNFLEFFPPNMFPRTGGLDLPIPSKNVHLSSRLMMPTRGQMMPMMCSFESSNERTRSRRNEGSLNQAENKKQFELDIERIMRGEDKRTTLMIKNIPNKYTSKMLLAAIDERHKGTYDFLYLPIDFKNKCNVGYAFINMTDPSLIIPFYHALNGKKWEKFNSEKVASLAYARIQGKVALIAHFQNSSLMNEDKRCRPILFHTDGPNAGDQVPFPMGVNIRPKPGKNNRSSATEENYQGGGPPLSSADGAESSNGNLLKESID